MPPHEWPRTENAIDWDTNRDVGDAPQAAFSTETVMKTITAIATAVVVTIRTMTPPPVRQCLRCSARRRSTTIHSLATYYHALFRPTRRPDRAVVDRFDLSGGRSI